MENDEGFQWGETFPGSWGNRNMGSALKLSSTEMLMGHPSRKISSTRWRWWMRLRCGIISGLVVLETRQEAWRDRSGGWDLCPRECGLGRVNGGRSPGGRRRSATRRGRKSQITGAGKEGSSVSLLRVVWIDEWGRMGDKFQYGKLWRWVKEIDTGTKLKS